MWAPTPDWFRAAACKGMDPTLFFPERGEPTAPAKQVCAGCEVREKCLEFALLTGEKTGVWGGVSEKERRRLRGWRVA